MRRRRTRSSATLSTDEGTAISSTETHTHTDTPTHTDTRRVTSPTAAGAVIGTSGRLRLATRRTEWFPSRPTGASSYCAECNGLSSRPSTGASYCVLERNCCAFVAALCARLRVRAPPAWLNGLATALGGGDNALEMDPVARTRRARSNKSLGERLLARRERLLVASAPRGLRGAFPKTGRSEREPNTLLRPSRHARAKPKPHCVLAGSYFILFVLLRHRP